MVSLQQNREELARLEKEQMGFKTRLSCLLEEKGRVDSGHKQLAASVEDFKGRVLTVLNTIHSNIAPLMQTGLLEIKGTTNIPTGPQFHETEVSYTLWSAVHDLKVTTPNKFFITVDDSRCEWSVDNQTSSAVLKIFLTQMGDVVQVIQGKKDSTPGFDSEAASQLSPEQSQGIAVAYTYLKGLIELIDNGTLDGMAQKWQESQSKDYPQKAEVAEVNKSIDELKDKIELLKTRIANQEAGSGIGTALTSAAASFAGIMSGKSTSLS